MERKTKDEKNLNKIKKLDNKNKRKYSSRSSMKKRIKNSKVITNVKEIGEDFMVENRDRLSDTISETSIGTELCFGDFCG